MSNLSINNTNNAVALNHDVSADLSSERVAKAVCTISFGEEICSPAKNPAAETFLNFARFFAPKAEAEIGATGRDEINFSWGDADYQLLCGAGTCHITRQDPTTHANTFLTGAGEFCYVAFGRV